MALWGLGSFYMMVQQPQRMRLSLVKFALIGAMTGTATSASYAYLSGSRRLERTSPWRDTVGDCIAQAQATCHSILEDYVPAGFYRFKFKTYIIPVSDMLFLL